MGIKQSLQSMLAIAKASVGGGVGELKSSADPLPLYTTELEAQRSLYRSRLINREGLNLHKANRFAFSPVVVNPETIVVTQGPSAYATAPAEYSTFKSGKKEIAFRTDAERAAKDLYPFAFSAAFIQGVGTYTSTVASTPTIALNSIGWASQGGFALTLDGDEVTMVYGNNASTNSAKIFVDGKSVAGSDALGTITTNVASSNHFPQWTRLAFSDIREREITLVNPNLQAIIIKKTATIRPKRFAGKALIFGDSNAQRMSSAGDPASLVRTSLAGEALECMGYDAICAAMGSTGFANSGGGRANNRGNYSEVMDHYLTTGIALGFRPQDYGLIWLFGTGNDASMSDIKNTYRATILKALSAFPNATILITSVYEGFNSPAVARALNDQLYASVQEINSMRVVFVGIDSHYSSDKIGLWQGDGCVAAPTGNGNADLYLGTVASGVGDRHVNALGCHHAAGYLSRQFSAAGIPYLI